MLNRSIPALLCCLLALPLQAQEERVDFTGLGDLMDLGHPVCFDVTHSTQLPGGGQDRSGGRPDRAALLARAATAAGVHAIFLETHPEPLTAPSDGTNMLPLAELGALLRDVARLRAALETGDEPSSQSGGPS